MVVRTSFKEESNDCQRVAVTQRAPETGAAAMPQSGVAQAEEPRRQGFGNGSLFPKKHRARPDQVLSQGEVPAVTTAMLLLQHFIYTK